MILKQRPPLIAPIMTCANCQKKLKTSKDFVALFSNPDTQKSASFCWDCYEKKAELNKLIEDLIM